MNLTLVKKAFSCLVLLGLLAASSGNLNAQDSLRRIEATRISEKIKIDGVLDEPTWQPTEAFSGRFYQLAPDNGAEASYDSKIYFGYDNKSLYIGAILYDPDPLTIPQELGDRDDIEINVDAFAVSFDPVKKGQNGFIYIVTAAGVQGDAVMTSRGFDENWDAVWNSEVKISEEGWVLEMEIPYSAIRFPNKEDQVWGINFYRISKRLNEETSWNFINREVQGELNQSGELHGLKDIKPPLRLSFLPYISAGLEHESATNGFSRNLAGGMDMKLGLSESFTLDMSLVPDFSQVQSDNVVLNLSPFEVRFDERRPFFTEGMNLFNKGRIFYSRRIGQQRGSVDEEDMAESEKITVFPFTTQLINATKLSGRSGKGTGIGLLNSVTANTYIEITDTVSNEKRTVLAEPTSNYNVFVVDQNLNNNSYVGFINTNVVRVGDFRDANVTLADFRFRDKSNTYSLSGNGGVSNVFLHEEGEKYNSQGFKGRLSFSKVSGKFQFGTTAEFMDDKWDINDLGFMRRNNQVEYSARVGYNIFKPFGIFNSFSSNIRFNYEQLYRPNTYVLAEFGGNINAQFKNFWRTGIGFNYRPFDNYDYFEPREEGYFWKTKGNFNLFIFLGTDDRKKFNVGGHAGMWHRPQDGALAFFGGLGPSYRVSNRFSVNYDLNFNNIIDGKGYVTTLYDENDELQDIIFGHRDQSTLTNTIWLKYTFTNKMGINFRLRHYWSWVEHPQFYDLQSDGNLADSNYNGLDENGLPMHNTTFNAFNIDMVYSWQVAPGSFFTAVWKNQIYSSSDVAVKSFAENLEQTFSSDGTNILTLKLVYFIDIAYFRRNN